MGYHMVRNVVAGCSLLAAACFIVQPSLAKDKADAGEEMLKTLNTDGDDTFEMPEVMGLAAKVFNAINPDGDKTLEPDETKGRLDAADFPKQAFPNNQEVKGDKTVDLYQWLGIARKRYEAADANKDGKLDAAELDSKAGHALASMISVDIKK